MPASTFLPINPNYNAPRSYVRALCVEFNAGRNWTQVDNVISCDYDFASHLNIVVLPSFYDWNSNVYSCNYVFDDQNSENFIYPSPTPVGFLAFPVARHVNGDLVMCLRIAFSPETPQLFDLPGAPTDYWRKAPPISP